MIWRSGFPKCAPESETDNVYAAYREARNNVDIAEHNLAVARAHLSQAELEVRKAMDNAKSSPVSQPEDRGDVRAATIEELALDFENSKQYVWDHYEVADRIRALLVSRPSCK